MIFAAALALSAVTDGPMMPSSKWVVDYRADMCLVSRQFGAKPALTMFGLKPSILMDGKSATIFLLTPNDGRRGLRHGSAAITLQPSGEKRTLDYDAGVPKGESLRVYEISADAEFMGHLGQATGLTIEAGKDSFSLSTGKVQPVLDAMATCNDDLIRSWGADPAARAEPSGHPNTWFDNSDSPRRQAPQCTRPDGDRGHGEHQRRANRMPCRNHVRRPRPGQHGLRDRQETRALSEQRWRRSLRDILGPLDFVERLTSPTITIRFVHSMLATAIPRSTPARRSA